MDPAQRTPETESETEKEIGMKTEQSERAAAGHNGDGGNATGDRRGNGGDSGHEDGGNAYIQVLACFILWFNSWGIANTYGVFQTYYTTTLLASTSTSAISWIGAVQAMLLVFGGLFTGSLFDAGHTKTLIATGTLGLVFGTMMLSLCHTYWQIFLAQAVMVGCGIACFIIPSLAVLPQYFQERRAFAMGVGVSGSSVGGVLYPIIFVRLQPRIGFPWTVRVIGFIALITLLVPLAWTKQKKQPAAKRKLVDWPVFRVKSYVLYCIGQLFAFGGLYIPFYYVSSFAQEKGIGSSGLSLYLVAIMNAASTFGRIVPNYFADMFGPLNVAIPFLFICSTLSFAWIAVSNTGGLLVFTLLYGFFSGAVISLVGPAFVKLSPDLSKLGTHMGMGMGFCGLGLLLGSPVAGSLLTRSGYVGPQAWCGALNAVAACFVLAARLAVSGPRLRSRI